MTSLSRDLSQVEKSQSAPQAGNAATVEEAGKCLETLRSEQGWLKGTSGGVCLRSAMLDELSCLYP